MVGSLNDLKYRDAGGLEWTVGISKESAWWLFFSPWWSKRRTMSLSVRTSGVELRGFNRTTVAANHIFYWDEEKLVSDLEPRLLHVYTTGRELHLLHQEWLLPCMIGGFTSVPISVFLLFDCQFRFKPSQMLIKSVHCCFKNVYLF